MSILPLVALKPVILLTLRSAPRPDRPIEVQTVQDDA